MDIFKIQSALKEEGIDGWLLYNFHGMNIIAPRILDLKEGGMNSRRYFYFIPAEGEPVKLVHRIEEGALDELPGEKIRYLSWQSLEEGLKKITKDVNTVAMEYSPNNAIPYVSLVDAGTVELVRSLGNEVVSSANLISMFEATLSEEQIITHNSAAKIIRQIVHNAFDEIHTRIKKTGSVRETVIQQFIMRRFEEHHMVTMHPPIVAVNEHAGNPHYEPIVDKDAVISEDDLVLIDLFGKLNKPKAVYADITWMAYTGQEIPQKYSESFAIAAAGRDAAVDLVTERLAKDEEIYGWEVDKVTRDVITEKGFGNCFIHRTGHSIGEECHGNGANMDNLETKDARRILPSTIFSVEPGIYTNTYGIRTEIDVLIDADKNVIVTGGDAQKEIIKL